MNYCHWKDFRVLSKAALSLILIGSFIAGCVTLPPVKAINSIKDIEGTWEGPFTSERGSNVFTTVTISADGEISLKNERIDRLRRLRIENGKAVIGKGSKMTLHEGERKRVLVLKGKSGTGQYTQVK